MQVFTLITELFALLDACCEAHGATRIDTAGDAYWCAAGLAAGPAPSGGDAAALLAVAVDLQRGLNRAALGGWVTVDYVAPPVHAERTERPDETFGRRLSYCLNEHWADGLMLLELSLDEARLCRTTKRNGRRAPHDEPRDETPGAMVLEPLPPCSGVVPPAVESPPRARAATTLRAVHRAPPSATPRPSRADTRQRPA